MSRKLKRILRFIGRVILAGAALGAAVLAYSVWESRHPVLSTYHVEVPNLAQSLNGYRIVQLSDLHRSALVPDDLIQRAVHLANSTNADAAVLTGDFVSSRASNVGPCVGLLSKLRTRQGSYAVLGNHDHWADGNAVTNALQGCGVTVLSNSSARLAGSLYLAGVDDKWAGKPDVQAAFEKVPPNACCVMLSHTPLAVDLFKGKRGLLVTWSHSRRAGAAAAHTAQQATWALGLALHQGLVPTRRHSHVCESWNWDRRTMYSLQVSSRGNALCSAPKPRRSTQNRTAGFECHFASFLLSVVIELHCSFPFLK